MKEQKNQLRAECKNKRTAMNKAQRIEADKRIFCSTVKLIAEIEPKILFCYVSSPAMEVNTESIIDYAIENGITVAVPKCVSSANEMEFFSINSRSELTVGCFGIYEPEGRKKCQITDYDSGLCIVPGLAFDKGGRRLGFGKGYYDRFLEKFGGYTAGLCYECCMFDEIPYEQHDAAMDCIITENRILHFKGRSSSYG